MVFQIPISNLPQLSNVLNLLTPTQKREYKKAILNGSGMNIRLTKKTNGGFLGTLLASYWNTFAFESNNWFWKESCWITK